MMVYEIASEKTPRNDKLRPPCNDKLIPLPLRTQSDTSLCSVQGLRTSCASVV